MPTPSFLHLVATSAKTTLFSTPDGRLYFQHGDPESDTTLVAVNSILLTTLLAKFCDHQIELQVRHSVVFGRRPTLFLSFDRCVVIADAPPDASPAGLADIFDEFGDLTAVALESKMIVRGPLPPGF